ncbi:MAG: ribonuclease catalytic domain-containing protein [Ardenticatenaceae bacterium]
MSETTIRKNSLVLYRSQPGRVMNVGKKVEIELEDGKVIKVSSKGPTLLHPGPIRSLSELTPQEGDIEEAAELLAGESTNVAELADLAYGEYTPATAWATWQVVSDGLYFRGAKPNKIVANDPEAVAKKQAARKARAARKVAWESFLERLEADQFIPEDASFLNDVISLALEQHEQSRALRALGRAETRENAHDLLLKIGYWDHMVNPYPQRLGAPITRPEIELPELPDEPRRDLTHLLSLAIDDAGSRDPDDALSWDNGRLWVHIADVAALITPNSPADLEARARGANLYLPEGTITMLPDQATDMLALGVSESGISPALSFCLDIGPEGQIDGVEIMPSWVRVTRTTYEEADNRLEESPYKELYHLAQVYEARRERNGAIDINLPEVKVRVKEGQVVITPLPPLRSRDLVREAMLMTGEAVARFALEHEIPLPFTSQDPPEAEDTNASTTAEMFALRRTFKRGQQKSTPAPHAGLGMLLYVQTTSPLRRYLDMVTHQQLRAYLRGEEMLDSQALMERVGAAEAIRGSVRLAERLSNQHWTLVYFLQNPDWQGEGIIVDRRGARDLVLIPELGYETRIYQQQGLDLDDTVSLAINDVNIPNMDAHFRVLD